MHSVVDEGGGLLVLFSALRAGEALTLRAVPGYAHAGLENKPPTNQAEFVTTFVGDVVERGELM